jgi:acyl-CoA thioesterase-1
MPDFGHRSTLLEMEPTGLPLLAAQGPATTLAVGATNPRVFSPIELMSTVAARFARDEAAYHLQRGRFGKWCDGIAAVRAHRAEFAGYWQRHNHRALAGTGPLWVALGDSAAQGLGARRPQGGYVGQTHTELIRQTGQPWRVLNLSRSGATIRDLLRDQLPRLAALPTAPELITCGVGYNDVLRLPLPKVRAMLRALFDALPDSTVVLDLPVPQSIWRIGRFAAPYVARVNSTIHAAAERRRLPVAYVSSHFTPPWVGKFGPDQFHPSDSGYRYWSRALLQAIPVLH